MADKVTKICMDIYRKLEKSRVLNVTERLQIRNNLEICYLYNLQWKYVKKYIHVSIQASIFLFVSSVLKRTTIKRKCKPKNNVTFKVSYLVTNFLPLLTQCEGNSNNKEVLAVQLETSSNLISPSSWYSNDKT
jgi:hypothetical protein